MYPNRLGNQINSGSADLWKQAGLDKKGNNPVGTVLRNQVAGTAPWAAQRTGFNAGLEGDYQNIFQRLSQSLTNQNYDAMGQRAGAATRAQFGEGQALADQYARASGLGAGAQLAGANGLASNAARAGAAAEESYRDPRRRQQDLMAAIQQYIQAQGSNPALEQIMAMFGPIETRNNANAQAAQGRGINGVVNSISPILGIAGGNFGFGQPQQPQQQQAGLTPGAFWGQKLGY